MNNPKLFILIASFSAIIISLATLHMNYKAQQLRAANKNEPVQRQSNTNCEQQLEREKKVNDAYLGLLVEHYKGWRAMDEAPEFGKVLIYTDQEQIFEATYDKTSRKWLVEVTLEGNAVYEFSVQPLAWRNYPNFNKSFSSL